jgi:hypothetical protein
VEEIIGSRGVNMPFDAEAAYKLIATNRTGGDAIAPASSTIFDSNLFGNAGQTSPSPGSDLRG